MCSGDKKYTIMPQRLVVKNLFSHCHYRGRERQRETERDRERQRETEREGDGEREREFFQSNTILNRKCKRMRNIQEKNIKYSY